MDMSMPPSPYERMVVAEIASRRSSVGQISCRLRPRTAQAPSSGPLSRPDMSGPNAIMAAPARPNGLQAEGPRGDEILISWPNSTVTLAMKSFQKRLMSLELR